jgi:hypothetical protein
MSRSFAWLLLFAVQALAPAISVAEDAPAHMAAGRFGTVAVT